MASVVTSTTAEWSVHFVPKGTRPPAPAHFHLIGTAGDGHYHQLAISSGREGWIKLHCRRLNGSFEASVTRPSDGLIRVQGIRQARKIAMRAFRDNALNGIEHYGRPIGEVYRRHPEYEHCRLFVEWSMFLDDIKASENFDFLTCELTVPRDPFLSPKIDSSNFYYKQARTSTVQIKTE